MASWKVGGKRDLPTSESDTWSGSDAAASIFAWAGGDDFDAAKARQGFAIYDADATDQRGSYKLPFAAVRDGKLTAIKGGVRAAKSRLRQTDAPDDVLDRAESLLNGYWSKWESDRSQPITIRRDGKDVELRSSLDVRVTEHVDGFSGYASTWWVADSYGTAMAPGSFKKSLREKGTRFPVLWNHNPDAPVGKHLSIKEDRKGLAVDIGIADDDAEGTTLLKRLRFGVPLGMSFGFRRVKSRAGSDDDPIDLTYMPKGTKNTEIEIYTENAYWESSPVTFPANETATIDAIRSVQNEIEIGALASLLEHIRAGTLTDEHRALVTDLVAAFTERSQPEPEPTEESTPLSDTSARHRRDIDVLLALARFDGLIGAQA